MIGVYRDGRARRQPEHVRHRRHRSLWTAARFSADEIGAMTDSIGHRGPDDHGLLVEGGVGIGMRRLSIVDLSPSGHQPLFNEDELDRRRLQRRDLQPPRPALAARAGRAPLSRPQRHRGAGPRLRAVRRTRADCAAGGHVRVRALRSPAAPAVPGARRRSGSSRSTCVGPPASSRSRRRSARWPSTDRVRCPSIPHSRRRILRLGYVPLAGYRLRGDQQARARHAPRNRPRHRRDARRRPSTARARRSSTTRGLTALVEQLRELLNASVRRHLMADVPTGLFLSGGLDSSALTVFANQHARRPRPSPSASRASDRGDETRVRRRGRRAGPETRTSGSISGPPTSAISIRSSTRSKSRWPTAPCCRCGTSARAPPRTSRSRCRAKAATRSSGGYARYFWGRASTSCGPVAAPHAAGPRHHRPAAVALARASSTSRAVPPRSPTPSPLDDACSLPRLVRHLHARTSGGRWSARGRRRGRNATRRCSRRRAS